MRKRTTSLLAGPSHPSPYSRKCADRMDLKTGPVIPAPRRLRQDSFNSLKVSLDSKYREPLLGREFWPSQNPSKPVEQLTMKEKEGFGRNEATESYWLI